MLPDIENLIVKYLTNSATANDLDQLAVWIKEPINKKKFKEYVDIHYSIFYAMKDPNTQEVLDELLSKIRKEKGFVYVLKNNRLYGLVAAIVVIGLLLSPYLFKDVVFSDSKEVVAESVIVPKCEIIKPGTDKAMLTLADGSQVFLEQGELFDKGNVNSNGKEIIYAKDESKEIKYNYLTIPRSGQFQVQLSDGTKVWLNSESQLKYPVNFIEGQSREVELVYGEAYFEVSPSTNHGGAKFKVFNKSQVIEVLGTEFNVKAYLGESTIYTTLVEGKVTVDSGNDIKFLKPSEQLTLNLKSNIKTIRKVDVYNEISWKDGVFSFEDKSLKEMMNVLSRWYDVDILFKNKAVENEEFVGVLRKKQELQDILQSIKNIGIIKEFEIYDKKVILE